MTTSAAQIVGPWDAPFINDDPYPFYASLREHAPVWRVPGTTTYFVSRWADVADATTRVEDFSSNLTSLLVTNEDGSAGEFPTGVLGSNTQMLAVADPPEHGPQRKLVVPHLTSKRLAAMESEVDQMAADLIDAGRNGNRIEWMGAVGDALPMTLVARVLGLPSADITQLISWAYLGTELLSGVHSLAEMGPLAQAAGDHSKYLANCLSIAMSNPGDDLLGDLARAVNAGDLMVEQAIGSLVVLVGAGGESTAGLIGNTARILAEQPDLADQVRSNPELLGRLIEEVMRLESPFKGHYRTVRRDCELAGVALAEGDHLLLLWASANRDPKEFDRPDRIDLDRRVSTAHLGFGRGIHFCVGAPLARLEARAAIGHLLTSTTHIAIDPDDRPVRSPSIFVRRHTRLGLVLQS